MPALEVAALSVEDALRAHQAGVHSLEIMRDLASGGLTPPLELVQQVRAAVPITLRVMLRPHAGDFLYTDSEMDEVLRMIEALRPLGVDGVVFGALTPEGDVDVERMKVVAHAAAPVPLTLHRALDRSRNPEAALAALIGPVTRVLTAGPGPSAWEGRHGFRQWVERFGGHFRFACSGGLRLNDLPLLVPYLGADEYHVGAAARSNGQIDPAKVRALLRALEGTLG